MWMTWSSRPETLTRSSPILKRLSHPLREYRWKLNPNKCVFGIPLGKRLGFIISHRSIEANPEKISTITKMKALTCIKDV
jgi:hypothetical protein